MWYLVGCQGGYLSQALDYAKEHTIYSEAKIPYREGDNVCTDDAFDKGHRNSKELRESYTLAGYKQITGTPNALKTALEDGPVIATIRAGNSIFRHFSKGVIDSQECRSRYQKNEADHAVLVVGYGKQVHT